MTDIKLRGLMHASNLSVKEGPLWQRVFHLEKALKIAIPPKSVSDRTCYNKVANWLMKKCCNGRFNPDEMLPRVIDYALEASSPGAKNPPAVFMSIMKKELNYPN
ncbi:MAG TPA: hypothetical protein DIU00_03310 [Phycisphaerales bacterium]|nr:hypothetical protein [Phycisphaerales bacterium]